MVRKGLATTAAVALALPVLVALPAMPALAAPAKAPAKDASGVSDVRELHRTSWKLDGKTVDTSNMASQKAQSRSTLAAAATPPVGTVRQWLGSDDFNGTLYRKD